MRTTTLMTTVALGLLLLTPPAPAQQNGRQGGGGLGGALDTLGGLLGGGSRTLHGMVVTTEGNTIVLGTDDRSTYRLDMASLDPAARGSLRQGQAVTITARGGRGDVLTATHVQPDADATSARTFQRVTGTVQESSPGRVLFETGEGLVLPVDVSRVHGLPYLAANQPATLYYEQGPKQEMLAVWIEPTAPPVSAAPAAAVGHPPHGVGPSR